MPNPNQRNSGARGNPTVGGYVLAGGRSRRMGVDKALLPWRGTTLLEWVASQVRRAAGNVTLVGAPRRYAHLGLDAIADATPGLGPLSGLEAALLHSGRAWNLVVACDMPNLDAGSLADLIQHARDARADVCAAMSPQGTPEPLCAVYHSRLLPRVQAALRERRLRLLDLLAQWEVVLWKPGNAGLTANVNRPEDWDELPHAGK